MGAGRFGQYGDFATPSAFPGAQVTPTFLMSLLARAAPGVVAGAVPLLVLERFPKAKSLAFLGQV